MIAFLIRFISLFKWLYNWMGVDFQQMKTIVATKLLMDNRRHVVGATTQKEGNVNASFIGVMLIYGILGLFFSYIIYVIPSFLISMTMYHSYLILMVSLTLVSDFSSVLLDTSDNTIILPRPVSSKTLLAARVTHIIIYLTQITLALSLGALVAEFIKFGWLIGLLLIVTTVLSLLFALILTNGLYLILMRFTSEEKLKNIINYFQIAMTFLMMGAYQILPRLMSKNFLEDSSFVLTWWAALVPPMWMAGLLDIFYSATIDSVHIVCALFAIGFSVVAAFLMSKFFSSTFSEKLADLGTTNAAAEPKQDRNGFLLGLRNIITKQGIERASFDLVSAALARDRKMKLKIYPSIGSLIIIMLTFIFAGKSSFNDTVIDLSNSSAHVFIIYSIFLVLQTVLIQVNISDDFKASWVFNAAPINKPALILLGSWKAVLASFFVPIYGVISVFVVLIWKINGVDDLIFGLVANIFVTLITIIVSSKHFPLSLEPNAKNQAGNFVKVIIIMMIIGAIGFGHYLLTKIEYGLWISFPLIIGLTYFCYAKVKATTWSQIDLG